MDEMQWQTLCYGTPSAEPIVHHEKIGEMTFQQQGGALRTLCYRGVEFLRAIRPVIRDDQWGTHTLLPRELITTRDGDALTMTYAFDISTHGAGAIDGIFSVRTTPYALESVLTLTARQRLVTCRSGLIVLLPLEGVVGRAVTVQHNDGTQEESYFPELISPRQPFLAIRGMRYAPDTAFAITLDFEGDVFEMEDQRNWSDASFKIYNRPLAWPTPYVIEAGDTVRQRLKVTLEEHQHVPA